VPEVLMAANAMKGGMAILKPLLVETGAPRIGKMVIGTVKGDIHDIGKNLVSMMMEGAGFEVVDLGINNAVENYLEALEGTARHPRHVGAADHDDALHEGRDRHAEGKGHPRRLTSCWWAARR
jgi:methanogenic corrinoid protein MtbC1